MKIFLKLFAGFIVIYAIFACIVYFTTSPELTKTDCFEHNFCREGLEYQIGQDVFTITKETCVTHGGEWHEKQAACDWN